MSRERWRRTCRAYCRQQARLNAIDCSMTGWSGSSRRLHRGIWIVALLPPLASALHPAGAVFLVIFGGFGIIAFALLPSAGKGHDHNREGHTAFGRLLAGRLRVAQRFACRAGLAKIKPTNVSDLVDEQGIAGKPGRLVAMWPQPDCGRYFADLSWRKTAKAAIERAGQCVASLDVEQSCVQSWRRPDQCRLEQFPCCRGHSLGC